MRRSGLKALLVCALFLMSSAACGTDERRPPYNPPDRNTYEPDSYEPPDPPEPPPVDAVSMPQELIGFWYREDMAGGGIKATRSYTFYTSAEYYYEQSFCTGSSCQAQGQEAGSVLVEPGVLTLYPTGGGYRQTRYTVQREYATNDIQLWLHDAFGPGVPDIYYLRG